MQEANKEVFASRVDRVFAALGQDPVVNAPPGWRLLTDQGLKEGRDADSSEGEEEGMPESLEGVDEQEEHDEYAEKASCQYRRAFEAEEEEDQWDRMAAGTYHRAPAGEEEPLALDTEIMEDNPYDRRLESHAHASSQAAAANGDAIPAAEGRSRPRPGSGAGQVWVPPHRREGYQPAAPGSDEPPPQEHRSSQGGRSGAAGLPLPSGGGGGPQGGRGGRGRGRGRAVPDYVKHPEKYTVYVLDEPLVVGGGLSHGAEQQQAVASAQAAVHTAHTAGAAHEEAGGADAELPAFGSGIQFIPRAKRHQAEAPAERAAHQPPGTVPSGTAAGAPKLGLCLADELEDEQEGQQGRPPQRQGPNAFNQEGSAAAAGHSGAGEAMEVDEGAAGAAGAGAAGRKGARRFRVRAGGDE